MQYKRQEPKEEKESEVKKKIKTSQKLVASQDMKQKKR